VRSSEACPYCLSRITDTVDVVRCPACLTPHHSDCWAENRGCAQPGCARVSRRLEVEVSPEPVERLSVSREEAQSARPHSYRKSSNPCMACGRQVAEGELYCPGCVPPREESQDVRNLGPVLVMLVIVAVVLAWIMIPNLIPAGGPAPPPPGQVAPGGK